MATFRPAALAADLVEVEVFSVGLPPLPVNNCELLAIETRCFCLPPEFFSAKLAPPPPVEIVDEEDERRAIVDL